MKEFNSTATTNKLLLMLVIPVVFYVLKTLSFIFIPLVAALLIALLFMPFLRWSIKKNMPKWLTMTIVVAVIAIFIRVSILLIKLSTLEILSVDAGFWTDVFTNMSQMLTPVLKMLGVQQIAGETYLDSLLKSKEVSGVLFANVGKAFEVIKSTVSMTLMSLFFILLLLAGSVNVLKVLENALFKSRMSSIRTFVILEKSIVKFLIVKTLVSIVTGITIGFVCYMFDVKFPIFWGLLTFGMHYIQLVGSIILTVFVGLFALAQIDQTGTMILFILIVVGVQIFYGSVLEPIFMGKTFSINTITILIMLMLWGFIWGVPGLILSVPITVVVKTILEQFPRTQLIAKILS